MIPNRQASVQTPAAVRSHRPAKPAQWKQAELAYAVTQGLRESTILIIVRIHFTANSGIITRTANDADGRLSLVKFATRNLDAAVVETQCPLTLKTVCNTSPDTGAAVIADCFHAFVQ